MGPRSRERGKYPLIRTRQCGAVPASMGPRSRERGKQDQAKLYALSLGSLQWGRAHVSAERDSRGWPRLTAYPRLQWGRAHVSAENSRATGGTHPPGTASMGPRSRERGKRYGPGLVVVLPRLASMGPRSRERGKAPAGWTPPQPPAPASMGPRSRERGKQGAVRRCPVTTRCFNGAALT